MSKPKGRFLFTWNEKKHPEVVVFFNIIEEGFYSHYIREAIAFYMKHQNLQQSQKTELESSIVGDSIKNIEKPIIKRKQEEPKSKNDNEYDTFNPDMI